MEKSDIRNVACKKNWRGQWMCNFSSDASLFPTADIFDQVHKKFVLQACPTCDDLNSRITKERDAYQRRLDAITRSQSIATEKRESMIRNLDKLYAPKLQALDTLYDDECVKKRMKKRSSEFS